MERPSREYYTIKLEKQTHEIAQVLRACLHPMPKNWDKNNIHQI
jgi:hypothetical protein